MNRKLSAVLLLSMLLISLGSAQTNSTDPSRDVVLELDQATWISEINWEPENQSNIRVVVSSEIPKQIALQEVPDFDSSSGSFEPPQSLTISPGENSISVPVNGREKLGIAINDQNDGSYLMRDAPGLLTGFGKSEFIAGVLATAMLIPINFSALRFWRRKKFRKPRRIG